MARIGILLLISLLPVAVGAQQEDSGPALSVDPEALASALVCPQDLAGSGEPVLLVHGTGTNARENFSWNLAATLPAVGIDVCTVDLPDRSLDDIQLSSEYVVHAIREVAARTGSRVDVLGHSQGALQPRWALRWWPDVRDFVDDYVSIAGPHHGTASADAACAQGRCHPAVHQMKTASAFITALNSSGMTPGEDVSYSSIYSLHDELVVPAETAVIDGAANVVVQEFCPGRPATHITIIGDGAVFDLIVDAFTQPGPVDPARLDVVASCSKPFPPGSGPPDPGEGQYPGSFGSFSDVEQTEQEPELRAYASGAAEPTDLVRDEAGSDGPPVADRQPGSSSGAGLPATGGGWLPWLLGLPLAAAGARLGSRVRQPRP